MNTAEELEKKAELNSPVGMITREELLGSKEYHIEKLQIQLFDQIERYLVANKLTRAKFADQIGVTKGYVSQILNGDYDFRLSKLVELALAIGLIPKLEFQPIDSFLLEDKEQSEGIEVLFVPSKTMEKFQRNSANRRFHPFVNESRISLALLERTKRHSFQEQL
jgi:transcriptional regulator with XRE-family HTH domain